MNINSIGPSVSFKGMVTSQNEFGQTVAVDTKYVVSIDGRVKNNLYNEDYTLVYLNNEAQQDEKKIKFDVAPEHFLAAYAKAVKSDYKVVPVEGEKI